MRNFLIIAGFILGGLILLSERQPANALAQGFILDVQQFTNPSGQRLIKVWIKVTIDGVDIFPPPITIPQAGINFGVVRTAVVGTVCPNITPTAVPPSFTGTQVF